MKIHKLDVPFAQVANELLNDPKLSWRAKGIFAYMQSKSDDYDFDSARMSKDAKDGRDGTRKGIKELMEQGYLTRRKMGDGRLEYTLQHTKAKDGNSGADPKTEIQSHNKERYIYNTLEYLIKIPEEDIIELTDKFDILPAKLRQVGEELHDYCQSRGKKYKNYKAFLRTCVRRKNGVRYKAPHIENKQTDYEIVDVKKYRPDFMAHQSNENL